MEAIEGVGHTRLLTIPEVAEVLRVSRQRAYSLAREGRIPTIKLGTRQVRVCPEALGRVLGTTCGSTIRTHAETRAMGR